MEDFTMSQFFNVHCHIYCIVGKFGGEFDES